MSIASIKLCPQDQCTGCLVCKASCNHDAIKEVMNEEGFIYPQIQNDACKVCHVCENVCPVLHPFVKNAQGNTYAAFALNDEIRKTSSSGGLFGAFALQVLSEGGKVVGASMDNTGYVNHIIIDSKEQLSLLQGSKYVQSYISERVYHEIRQYLRQNIKVLFCGTPCQVAGIKKYIKTNEENLYTIDIVCHGVPSPSLFAAVYKVIKLKMPNMLAYNFRDYKNWLVCSSVNVNVNVNGQVVNRPLYGKCTFYQDAFLKGFIHRENCYSCPYASKERVGDITLGDFWGIGRTKYFSQDIRNGCSLVIVNSERGQELFGKIQDKVFCEERDIQETIDGGNEQLVKSSCKPSARNTFYKDFHQHGMDYVIKKYHLNLKKKKSLAKKLMSTIKKMICH